MAAIARKAFSNRCNHMETTLQQSLRNAVTVTIAEARFAYDEAFFFNDCSDRSKRSDHVETTLSVLSRRTFLRRLRNRHLSTDNFFACLP